MSPLFAPACLHINPVNTGRMRSCLGAIVIITTITTGTGTTGSGRVVVRR